MRVVLAKTAYSPLLKSAGDYSCGVFDARGEMVAQGPDLPIHLGSMPDAVRAVVAAFGSGRARRRRVHPQRSLFRRQPFARRQCGAAGLLRRPCCSATPACARTGPTSARPRPGSYGAVTDIYGEGLRLPPLRLISRGVLNVDLEKVILANVRTPDERKGDLGAQLAATLRATERLKGLAERYGAEQLVATMAEVMNYSERLMRAMLSDLPDGEGYFEDFCDGDGIPDDARRQGRAVLDPHARDQDRRPRDGRLRRQRPASQGAHQRTAVGHCVRRLLRPQDGGRSQQSHSAQLRLLAHHRGQGAQGLGGQRGVSSTRRLRQPRDFASRRRHGDGRAGRFLAEPGDGLQPGHIGDPHAGRPRSTLGPALRLLRDHQGRVRRAPQQGRHPCRSPAASPTP